MKERARLALFIAAFAACWFFPVGDERFWGALQESLFLVRWYAREHVLLCLIPAFFIAGAISVFVSPMQTAGIVGGGMIAGRQVDNQR